MVKLEYSWMVVSILWLLISWLLMLPSDQQLYIYNIYIYHVSYICRGNGSFSSARKYFYNHLIFQCWEVQIYFIFHKINSAWQRLRIMWDFAITITAKRSSVFIFPIIFLCYSLLVPGIQDFYVQFLAGLLSHSGSLFGTELINIVDHTGYGLRTWIEIAMTGTNHKSVI